MNISTSDYTVLVVDDIAANLMLVQAVLRREKYTRLSANNGIEALEIAKKKLPNLILLDIMMPGMDGYQVLQHLSEDPTTKDIPVIVMSALSDIQSVVKAYQLGAVEYVTKPFQREELLKCVEHRFELFCITRMKNELEETIEYRDTFYSVIAHDLRSPLSSLKMMNNAISGIVEKENVSNEVYNMIQMMNKTSEEVFLLLDNLLMWSNNRLKKQRVYKQATDINAIIRSTAGIYASMAAQKGIKIVMRAMENELPGVVDIDMLQTIIRNLISNAIKFTPSGGSIVLKTQAANGYIQVSVKDSGVGINKENQEKLLKEKTHYTTYGTNNEKGSGLGLMLCKDFIQLHEGKLRFKSEEGKGSTFYFSLKADLPEDEQ